MLSCPVYINSKDLLPSLLSMLPKSLTTRIWKHQRWKNYTFFSTQNTLPHVISLNISITHHCKQGNMEAARKVFDEMPHRTVVSYNTLISGYTKWGMLEEALSLVAHMHKCDVKLNDRTFSTALSVCARLRSIHVGKQIHTLILKTGSEDFEYVGSSLLNLYSTCYEIGQARRVFDMLHKTNGLLWNLMLVGYVHCDLMKDAMDVFMNMPTHDVISWTTLISGFSRRDDECGKALKLFHFMRVSGEANPNEFTFDNVLRAIGRLGDLYQGKIVHGLCLVHGFQYDVSVNAALVELYCSCNAVEDAMKIHKRLNKPCLNSSNSLIGGLISIGRTEDAKFVFGGLIEKNPVTYNLMIKGYGVEGRVEDSKKLFMDMPQRTIISSNTMISVYARNGQINEAYKLFEQTKMERSIVTWNSMISAYIQNDQPEEAVKLYVKMHRVPLQPSRSTFSALFRACASLGSLQQGKLLHAHVIKTPFDSNIHVGTSLVDMYAKCGNIRDAGLSFTGISSPNVAAWTSLISGHAHHGMGTEAIILFQRMLKHGVDPNAVTFTGILLGCGRAGLIAKGKKFFSSMPYYGVEPNIDHYTCMVDLLGRSGYLLEAEEFINRIPVEADGVVWGVLLSACRFWMNMEIAERVAAKMFDLDANQMPACITMSNIYAGVHKWEEVLNMRKRLRSMEVKKDPGCSWIEVKDTVHVFSVEDTTHPHCNEIYTVLGLLTANANPNYTY